MSKLSRRSFVAGGAVLGGAAAAALLIGPQHRAGADGTTKPAPSDVTFGPVTVTPNDARYPEMVTAFNRRFVGSPATVQLVGTSAHVKNAVAAAVNAGQRISIRGGGHCYANFVYNSAVQNVIDLSMMSKVYYDTARSAF